MAQLCAGNEIDLKLDREALVNDVPAATNRENVDFLVLKYAAVGETLAAALLTECRRRAKDRVARALFTSLAADEVHHARLGWYYAAYRSPLWSVRERQGLADRVGEFVVGIEQEFWMGRDAPESAQDAAHALGVLDSATQRDVIAMVMQEEVIPAMDALGLGGSELWAARRRGASGQ
jgi:hypothetical protein